MIIRCFSGSRFPHIFIQAHQSPQVSLIAWMRILSLNLSSIKGNRRCGDNNGPTLRFEMVLCDDSLPTNLLNMLYMAVKHTLREPIVSAYAKKPKNIYCQCWTGMINDPNAFKRPVNKLPCILRSTNACTSISCSLLHLTVSHEQAVDSSCRGWSVVVLVP